MTPSVRASLRDLGAARVDLLVIGGGITGAGIAREAALAGRSVALVEAGDLGGGTSSRSSRLIHGGLRYLEQRAFPLVFEALRERGVLLRLAPHLVRPLPFVLPVWRGDRVPRWKIRVGLSLYDLLAAGGNVRRHRTLGKRALLAEEPLLRDRGLTGGAIYWDAQCDDARLTLAIARDAARRGALVANHMEATALLQAGGRLRGVRVRDRLHGGEAEVHARVVVNATGPWADRVRRLEEPTAAPLLRLTSGAHAVVPRARLGHRHAIIFTSPLDGRVMFVLPWNESASYIGTTDTDVPAETDPAGVAATEAEVQYLLRSANALFPAAHLEPGDVRATFAGLRPLLAADPGLAASAVSREHRIVKGRFGMLTIAGGKLTTWRRMAAELVTHALGELAADPDAASPPETRAARRQREARSRSEPLPGGEASALDGFRAAGLDLGLGEATVEHLLRGYGAETPALYALCREDPALREPLHPAHPAIAAQVVYAVRREFAGTVEDVLVRRIHLDTETADGGEAARPVISRLLAGSAAGGPGSRGQGG